VPVHALVGGVGLIWNYFPHWMVILTSQEAIRGVMQRVACCINLCNSSLLEFSIDTTIEPKALLIEQAELLN
jgi:hypothetical protein